MSRVLLHMVASTVVIFHSGLVLKMSSLSREAKHNIEGPLWGNGLIIPLQGKWFSKRRTAHPRNDGLDAHENR